GGTRISSAYNLANKIIDADHPPADWNVYVLHFSDGDNWGEDNRHCINLLRDHLLPKCNLFGYGQVESPYGSGEFYRELEEAFDEGRYRMLDPTNPPASIEEARLQSAESGTASVLDMLGVAGEPRGDVSDVFASGDIPPGFCMVAPLSRDQLVALYGTETPTR